MASKNRLTSFPVRTKLDEARHGSMAEHHLALFGGICTSLFFVKDRVAVKRDHTPTISDVRFLGMAP